MLEYLQLKIGDEKQEKMFQKYDKDQSGFIDYDEFKQVLPGSSRLFGFILSRAIVASSSLRVSLARGTMDSRRESVVWARARRTIVRRAPTPSGAHTASPPDRTRGVAVVAVARSCPPTPASSSLTRSTLTMLPPPLFLVVVVAVVVVRRLRGDEVWLRVCNLNKELDDRGILYGKFESAASKRRKLEDAIFNEEEAERRAMAEAERWRQWQGILREKEKFIKRAHHRAEVELQSAMDTAGQVVLRVRHGTNERTNGRTNERTNERTNAATRTNARSTETKHTKTEQ